MLADGGGAGEEAVFLDGFDGGKRGGAGSGVAAEGSAESADAGGIHDFGAAGYGGDGHATAEGFGHGDQIRLDAEVLGGEPFAGAGEAGLHFVGDEEDAVLAADILQQLEVVARGNDEATFAENGFGDHGGDGFGSDGALEGVFEMMREGFGGGSLFAAVGIGERNTVDVAGERLEAGFIGMRLAGQRHGEKRAAMEGVLETDDGGALGVDAGDLDGVFDGFGARVDKDSFLREVTRREGVEFFRDGDVPFIRSDREAEMQVLLELLADGGEDARRAVADVEAADSASEIEIAIAVDVFDDRAIGGSGEIRRAARRT